jgi:hypothetical protein
MSKPLWDQNQFVDSGDMSTEERSLLITLVRTMFVTRADTEWSSIVKMNLTRVCRELSNLGLSLVVDDKRGVAWAEQVPDDIRPKQLPQLRRNRRPESAATVHAALSLRRHWDICESRGESDPHITDDELRTIIQNGPLGKAYADDAEKMETALASTKERLREIGLIKQDRAAGTMRLLPTVLVLIDNDMCQSIIESNAKTEEDTK